MSARIEFGQDEFQTLIELKAKVDSCEKNHVENVNKMIEMQKEIDRQKKIVQNMIWAGSRVAILAGGGFAGLMAIGYWLMDALNFRAVTAFFKTLRGE